MSVLPDFQQPVSGDRFRMFYPYQMPLAVYPFLVLPESLELCQNTDGKPDLQIEYVRTAERQFGVLRLTLLPKQMLEEALQAARGKDPQATVSMAAIAGGFFRLWPFGKSLDLDAESAAAITSPQRLTRSDNGQARFELNLPTRAIEFIAGALSAQAFPYSAYAELQVEGQSPRVDVKVEFDAQDLFASILPKPPLPPNIAWNDLIAAFGNHGSLPLLRTEGLGKADIENFAEAMAYRALAAYGTLIAADRPSEQRVAMLLFTAPSELPHGRVIWDLSAACKSFLPVVQVLNPFDAASQFARQRGIDSLVARVDVPALDLGTRLIKASALLPPAAPVKEIEVEVFAPATEHRRHPISESLSLTPPSYTDETRVRFSTTEPARFKVRYTLILNDNREFADERDWDDIPYAPGEQLYLHPADLPAKFVNISADLSLLEQASLEIGCHLSGAGKDPDAVWIKKLQGKPNAVFVLDKKSEALINVTAHGADGKSSVVLEPFAAEDRRLSLYDFASYGPHRVSVTCEVEHGQEITLEFVPQGGAEGAATPKRLSFSTDTPTMRWAWHAKDIFRPGYRYRLSRDGKDLRDGWIERDDFTQPLILSSNGTQRS